MASRPEFLNCNNSVADYLISLKFGTEFDPVEADTLRVFKVKGSKVKVAW